MKYDYIISGTGAAGLSLAYYLSQSSLKDKQVLLLDKVEKNKNDRTWSFWEAGQGTFEEVVHHQWEELFFKSPSLDKLLDIAPLRYKMIRGIDFYNYVLNHIRQFDNFTIKQEEVKSIENQTGKAIVHTSNASYEASYVFNSIIFNKIDTSKYNYVAQHFGGWLIRTKTKTFNPNQAVLMDFRIPQVGETRFMYLLPTSEDTALLEATAFSNNILTAEEYGQMIKDYIQEFTEIGEYEILHKEIGVIPMTDYNFKQHNQPHIVQIGTMGGQVKPSSGYAFTRIQNHTQKIIQQLEIGKSPHIKESILKKRFMMYDTILLNVMLNNRVPAHRIFSQLFKRNKGSSVLKFLNEQTTIPQEIVITNTAPHLPFIIAAFDEMRRSIARRLA